MVRRLVLSLAVVAVLGSVNAFALGLGEVTILSALNQKLSAEIELTDVGSLSESEIVAQLATAEDFKRVGVERFFYLTGLRFHVDLRQPNHAVLKLTSEQPITEPYLNFIVQIVWPSGRLLKEYTVLLDPPTYKDEAAPAVASPGRSDPGGGPAGRVERTPTRPDSQVSLDSAPRSTQPETTTAQPPSDRLTSGSYGVTDRDDTLWRIAQRARPSADVTVQQNMIAIQRMNPDAFIHGNINLLKAGYTLRLPKEADLQDISTEAAIGEVKAQNEAWQNYRRGGWSADVASSSGQSADAPTQTLAGQVDATAKPTATAAPSRQDGELRIVAGDASEGGTGAGGGNADVASLEGELAATKEEAARIQRERDEATARLGEVTAQAEQTKREIEVRDQQIAQMQQQLKAASERGAAESPTPSRPGAGETSIFASPILLIGAAIALVLIVGAGLMRVRARRRNDGDRLAELTEPTPMRATPTVVGAAVAEADEIDSSVAPIEEASAADDVPQHEGAQTGDVIGEADIYIAYGRYPQAVSLLLTALDEDPTRSDVRVKLLEVYAETKDAAAFETQLSELLTRCDDQELLLEARELEAKLREAVPAAAGVASTHPEPPIVEDFDLDLDDVPARDELSSERSESAPLREAADDLGGDLGIEFKLDDEPKAQRGSASGARALPELDDSAVATADDGDDFDLEDLEFETPTRAEGKPQAKSAADSDDAFDFLNEEDAATTKLDLARAYIDMGDEDGAREILNEVVQEGSGEQQQAANALLAKLK